RKLAPSIASFDSSRSVQSHSQQAHGSSPFRSRHFARLWASCTRTRLKYSSQYGRSSASGMSQKQISTHFALPSSKRRASSMLRRYSSPATEPAPSVPESMARRGSDSLPGLTRAVARERVGAPSGAASLSVPCQALVGPEVGAAHGARLWERSKRPPLQFRDVSTGLRRGRLLRSQSLAPCAALSKRPPLQFRDVSTGLR